MLLKGKCHCGNIAFELDWKGDPAEIPARACDCSFCVKHGGVWTSNAKSSLRVKVADTSPAVPAPRAATTDETGGRGLILVEALADQWGFEPHSSGKVVWVTFEGAFG